LKYRLLGNTGIKVSRLCFGALTVGPLQAGLPVEDGARVICCALDAGVNFIDTAELYGTYPYIRKAIRDCGRDIVIVSKSYAYTYEDMQRSVERALRELNRNYIDIFMLHEQESKLTMEGHWEAINYLIKAKINGTIRSIGISTHHVEGVLGALNFSEIDVIHPLINIGGIGIQGGTVEDMLSAIAKAASSGKGLYGMKALGGGNLLGNTEEAFRFVLSIPGLASVAVGMRTVEEVQYNAYIFDDRSAPDELKKTILRQPRALHIENWCRGCGQCLDKCQSGALSVSNGRAAVDRSVCTLCGYCGAYCPDFCIKVI